MTDSPTFRAPRRVRFKGTREERFTHLDRIGRRCDGNSRQCTHPAVDEFDLLPADGHGNPIPGASTVVKKSCAPHRVQFLATGRWVPVEARDVNGRRAA